MIVFPAIDLKGGDVVRPPRKGGGEALAVVGGDRPVAVEALDPLGVGGGAVVEQRPEEVAHPKRALQVVETLEL